MLLVLILLLRALIALLLAAATVLLFGTALGVSALMFNHVFVFPGADPAVPLVAFVFLVALGIDYSIFLMTRAPEEVALHGPKDGVLRALSVTGGVITSAGVVLATTFAAPAVIPILFLAQIAFIVAFGVLLDTLIVRTLLVPALACDLGQSHLVADFAEAREASAPEVTSKLLIHTAGLGPVALPDKPRHRAAQQTLARTHRSADRTSRRIHGHGFAVSGIQDDRFIDVPRDRITVASPGGLRNTEALCRLAVQELPMDGAAIVVGGRQDSWQLVHATDPVITQLDELQYTLGEGPRIDSYRTRRPVLIPDLEAASAFERWPGFAHEATPVGARSMFAFPLLIGDGAFGVVEFYARQQGPLENPELAMALVLVDRMMRVTLDDLARPGVLDAAEEGEDSVFGRTQVAQATGMVSVQLHTSVTNAFAQLRARAFAQGRPVGEIADEVISRRYRFTNEE